jgi:xanthine dehydrogenase accessory factor
MHEIAKVIVADRTRTGGVFARFIDLQGFGGRRSHEAAAMVGGVVVGSLLGGAADAQLAEAAKIPTASVLTVEVSDNDAVGCGLACGGRAQVLVAPIDTMPLTVWEWIASGETVVVAALVAGDHIGSTMGVRIDGSVAGDLGDVASTGEALSAAHEFLARPKDLSKTINTASGPVLLTLFRSPTKVLVIGEAALADALGAQGGLLGWSTVVVSDQQPLDVLVGAAHELGPGDALVVLSHDIAASTAVLAAALRGRCGYVGALGSRHTQTARSDELRSTHLLSDDTISRIHGPVGLDLGSRTPEETALSVAAEIVATLSGRSAQSLRNSSGALNG